MWYLIKRGIELRRALAADVGLQSGSCQARRLHPEPSDVMALPQIHAHLCGSIMPDLVPTLLLQSSESSDLLTPTEMRILMLLADGKTTKDIATMLYLSALTVGTHRRNICRKCDLHSTAELIAFAVRRCSAREDGTAR
jgi:DNA-binding CsgD family transcriptional regulator